MNAEAPTPSAATNRKIKALFQPPTVLTAASTVAAYVFAIPMALAVSQLVGHVAMSIGIAVLVSSLLKGVNNIVHECSHRSFSSDGRFNHVIGSVLSVLLLMDFTSYKREHVSHHRYLGNYERDLDFQIRRRLRHGRPFTWSRILRDLVTLRACWFYLPRVNLAHPHHLAGVAIYAATLAALFAAGATNAAIVLLGAYAGCFSILRYFIDIVDHGGLYRDHVTEIYKSRNFIVRNRAIRWLLFPRNDCYHLVHHLYPYLPVASFGKAHVVLMEEAGYQRLPHEARLGTFESSDPIS
jgi:fatty acid desaturase